MKKIVVLIPCYNEAEAISGVIRKVPVAKLNTFGYEVEVLVIDNNSTDGTAAIARQAGARVVHERKQGKGNAIRRGFYSLPEDTSFVVMLDGDDTYRTEEILRLVEPIDSGFAQVILGSRMLGNISQGSMRPFNRLGNIMYSWLVRMVYGAPVTDVLTGYFAWSAEAVRELRPHLVATDFAIEMEMVTKMARLGLPMYSVPISYDARQGDSSLHPIRDGYRILRMYLRNLNWHPLPQPPTVSRQLRAAEALINESPTSEPQKVANDSSSI